MKVRIYGLPRTGTNFLEYLIRKNTDLEYKNEYDVSSYINQRTAIKHCKPKDDGKDLYILILKNEDNFVKSYNKWRKTPKSKILGLYNTAINDYINFHNNNEGKVIIVAYEHLLGNEIEFLKYLSEEYGVKLNEDIDIPKNRMDRSGGKGVVKKEFKTKKLKLSFDEDSKIYPYLLKIG